MRIFQIIVNILSKLFGSSNTSPIPPVVVPPIVPPVVPPSNNPDISSDMAKIVAITNQERAKSGAAPLQVNQKLMQAAQKYAKVMADRNKLSHSLGSEVSDRISAEGYKWQTCGENIAWNYQSPEAVMNGWMNSPGHRRNILNPDFREIGVAVAFNSQGEPYHCQDFGTPMQFGLHQQTPGISPQSHEESSNSVSGEDDQRFRNPAELTTGDGIAASSIAIVRR